MHRDDIHPMREAAPGRRHPIFRDAVRLAALTRADRARPDPRDDDDPLAIEITRMLRHEGCRDAAKWFDLSLLASQVVYFVMTGRNIVMADPTVEAMLERTDLGTLQIGDLKFPHTTTYVAFGPATNLAIDDGSGRRIDGAYVTHDEATLMLTLTTSPRAAASAAASRPWPHDGEDTYLLRARIGNPTRLLSDVVDRDLVSSVYDEEFKAELAKVPAGPERDAALAAMEAKADERGKLAAVIRRGVMLALNVLGFMTAKPADAESAYTSDVDAASVACASEPGRKGFKARQKLVAEGRYPIVVVGRSVGRSREAQAFAPGASPAAHARKGHWRPQRYGKLLAMVKVIWIWPTTVNGGPGTGRVYKVEGAVTPVAA